MYMLMWNGISNLNRGRRESGIRTTQEINPNSLNSWKCLDFFLMDLWFKKIKAAYPLWNSYNSITDITVSDFGSASKDLYAFLLPQSIDPSAQSFS